MIYITILGDGLWEELFSNIYDYENLKVPWYVVFGNHDYGSQGSAGSISAQISYDADERWNADYCYLKQFELKNTGVTLDIVFIDTTLLGGYRY